MTALDDEITAEQVAAANTEPHDDADALEAPDTPPAAGRGDTSPRSRVSDTAALERDDEPDEPDERITADDDDDDDDDDEPEREQRDDLPAALAVTDQLMEKGFRQAEKEAVAHAERLARYFGPAFADLEACPLCPPILAGWRFPGPPEHMTPEQISAVRAAIGLPEYSNLRPSKYAGPCEGCGGMGRVITGSQVRGQESVACPECGGLGWKAVGTELDAVVAKHAAHEGGEPIPIPEGVRPGADPWGRSPGHPGYMVMPYLGMPEHQKPDNYAG